MDYGHEPRGRGEGGGGGTSLVGLNGYVQLNRVSFSGSWVLDRVCNFTF